MKRPETMRDLARNLVWKATYEPFGTVATVTGAAANNSCFPGQWFQIEAGLAYDWNRHYDSTIGRYTQPDPLADIRPNPPLPVSALGRIDTAPGLSLLANTGLASLHAGAQIGLQAALANLLQSRQDGLGLGTDFAENSADTVPRADRSLYAYAANSSLQLADPTGLDPMEAAIGGAIGARGGTILGAGACIELGPFSIACGATGRYMGRQFGQWAGNAIVDLCGPVTHAAQNNRQTRKRISGLRKQINSHTQKMNNDPNSPASSHWETELKAWNDEIERLRQRLPNGR